MVHIMNRVDVANNLVKYTANTAKWIKNHGHLIGFSTEQVDSMSLFSKAVVERQQELVDSISLDQKKSSGMSVN